MKRKISIYKKRRPGGKGCKVVRHGNSLVYQTGHGNIKLNFTEDILERLAAIKERKG